MTSRIMAGLDGDITSECYCKQPTDGQKGRNLVVCIDGTSNRFTEKSKGRATNLTNVTNIIKMYKLAEKSTEQLTFYNSGIGTYARPSRFTLKHIRRVLANFFDKAIARRFEPIVLDAYRWLSDNYEVGDRIFLFGFSRGAYQVRVLSAMIDRVGLIHKGNTKQIPFAYELYSGLRDKSRNTSQAAPKSRKATTAVLNEKSAADVEVTRIEQETESSSTQQLMELEDTFKETFCREVNVHFVGVWDTVSSIGIMRGESHPDAASGMKHVCYFRHALALDERRVKFLPEFVHGGAAASSEELKGIHPHTKEVWFAGAHSDVGGTTNSAALPASLWWMVTEAATMGLRIDGAKLHHEAVEANTNVNGGLPISSQRTESLKGVWWPLECLPIKRLSYNGGGNTTRIPHLGSGRRILQGQKVHASVFEDIKRDYTPKARLPQHYPDWKDDQLRSISDNIESWGTLEFVIAYKKARNLQERQDALQSLRRIIRSEPSAKLALRSLGICNVLRNLPTSRNEELHLEDLHTVRVILDEVYAGGLPERLAYSEVQPLVSHILAHGNLRDLQSAHQFILRFTDFAPVKIRAFRDPTHTSPVLSASFLSENDSGHVIAAYQDGNIHVWNVKTGKRDLTFTQDAELVWFACSGDGRFAASTSSLGRLYVWDLAERSLYWEGVPPQGSLGPLRFVAGLLAISAEEGADLYIWNVDPEELKNHGIKGAATATNELLRARAAKSSKQRRKGIETKESEVLYSHWVDTYVNKAKQLKSDLLGSMDGEIVLSRDNRFGAVGRTAYKGGLRTGKLGQGGREGDALVSVFWNDPAGQRYAPLVTLLGGARESVRTLAFTPDNKHLIAGVCGGDRRGRIRVWDTEKWLEEVDIPAHQDNINGVFLSANNERIVSCSDDGTVCVWDVRKLLSGQPRLYDHNYVHDRCVSHGRLEDSPQAVQS